jgi:hypothetical protein
LDTDNQQLKKIILRNPNRQCHVMCELKRGLQKGLGILECGRDEKGMQEKGVQETEVQQI